MSVLSTIRCKVRVLRPGIDYLVFFNNLDKQELKLALDALGVFRGTERIEWELQSKHIA